MHSNDFGKKHRRGSSPPNQGVGPEFDTWGVDWMEARRLVFDTDASFDTTAQGSGGERHSGAPANDNVHPGSAQSNAAE